MENRIRADDVETRSAMEQRSVADEFDRIAIASRKNQPALIAALSLEAVSKIATTILRWIYYGVCPTKTASSGDGRIRWGKSRRLEQDHGSTSSVSPHMPYPPSKPLVSRNDTA